MYHIKRFCYTFLAQNFTAIWVKLFTDHCMIYQFKKDAKFWMLVAVSDYFDGHLKSAGYKDVDALLNIPAIIEEAKFCGFTQTFTKMCLKWS